MNKGILLKQFGAWGGSYMRKNQDLWYFLILSFVSHFVCIQACRKNELNEI